MTTLTFSIYLMTVRETFTPALNFLLNSQLKTIISLTFLDDEASAEEDPDDDEPEDADDDDDDDDDESAEDEDDDDAIDFFSELLGGDDDEKPKPKPTTAAPVVAAVESVAPEVVEPVVAAAVNPPKKVVDEPEIEVEVVEDEDLTEDEPEPPKIPPTRAVKPKKPTAVKPDLPPLNLQNTPALLELQAQLTGSSVKNGGTFEEVPLAKPTKPSKKKKVQKGSLKKQNAIIANTIEEDEPFVDEAEKTAPAASESPVYTLVVKKTDEKPEVVVEGPMVPVATVQKPLKKKVKGTKTTTTTTTTEAAEEDESEEYVEENEEATTLAA